LQCRPGCIKLRPDYRSLGRFKGVLAGINGLGRNNASYPAGPGHPSAGWAEILLPQLGWSLPAPEGPLVGACPGWATSSLRPGGPASSPARPAHPGTAPPRPRLGQRPRTAAGPAPPGPALGRRTQCSFPRRASSPAPGWAGSGGSSLAGIRLPGLFITLGWAGSGGSGLAGIYPLGPPSVHYSGRARPGFPGPGRINPLQAEICLLRGIFLIRHILQHLVPVLGRLWARTGTSSIVVCWSWDASWLRPAHSPLLVGLILRRRIRLMTWRSIDSS
jgi:hypothetical protein